MYATEASITPLCSATRHFVTVWQDSALRDTVRRYTVQRESGVAETAWQDSVQRELSGGIPGGAL